MTSLFTKKPKSDPLLVTRYSLLQKHLLPLTIYLLGAMLFTWPLVLNLSDRVIRTASGDVWQQLWHTWWVKFSLWDLHELPFYTDYIYYPQRVDLLLDALNVATGVISIPFQLVFGLVATFNLFIILSLAISAYAAYLLAGYLTGNYWAAFVAGVIYGFCPLVGLWQNLGQLDLLPTFWFAFYILCYLKTLRGENWRWNALGTIVCFVAMSLTSWYYAYYGLMLGGLMFLYQLYQQLKEWRGTLLRGVGTLVGAGLLLSPIILRTANSVGGEQNIGKQPLFDLWYNSAALTDFIKPGSSAVWGLFGARADSDYQGLFLGFVVLALGLFGLITNFRRVWLWGLAALLFVELSLGPTLKFVVKDKVLATTADAENGLPTPNRLLYALPFGDIASIPLVAIIVVVLMLAVLVAFGVTRLQENKRIVRFAGFVPIIAAGLIFLEFLQPLPRTLDNAAPSKFFQQIQASRYNFAVIDLPDAADSLAMFNQTFYKKPMVGGYTARQLAYPFALTPGVKELRSNYPSTRPRDIFDPATLDNTAAVLNYYNLRYVIYHKNLRAYNVSAVYKQGQLEYIRSVFKDTPPNFEDDDLLIWQVADLPGATKACGTKAVLPGRLGGWNERLINDMGEVYRWMDGNAEVNFFNPTSQPLSVLLDTEAESWQQPRLLQLLQQPNPESKEYKLVQELSVSPQRAKLQIKLTLQPGPNRVQFKTVEPGVKVDNRVQAILFYSFKISDAAPPKC